MYHESRVDTFQELASELRRYKKLSIRIYSDSPSWGNSVAMRVQSIFLEDAKQNGGSPMSASYDGFEELKGERYNLFKFSLTDVENKSLIHHARLTRFKEEEL